MQKSYRIVVIRPEGYQHSDAFAEIADTLCFALRRLGMSAEITENDFSASATNIILGSNLVSQPEIPEIPADSIIYNLEQIDAESLTLKPMFFELVRRFETWDYSLRNIERLAAMGLGARLRHVPIGYVPELSRIPEAEVQDIDVLFYGSINPRRAAVIEELRKHGIRAGAFFGVYGKARDLLIARAKVVLNIHYYEASIFEIVRVSYLLANRKAVVAEMRSNTEVDEDMLNAAVFVPYEKLVPTCIELVRNDSLRREQEERAFQLMSARDECKYLADALQTSPHKSYPLKLNFGCGRNKLADCLNLDIDPILEPDILLDMNKPFPFSQPFDTARFGRITLNVNSFEEILAQDVLEHLPDIKTAMTNCLKLLKPGGTIKIRVPYDLSLGAWQDPTHVRAFNEHTWVYFTEWSFYLGWERERFEMVELKAQFSSLGKGMLDGGFGLEEVMRTPRAVHSLNVVLRKKIQSESEFKELITKIERGTGFD